MTDDERAFRRAILSDPDDDTVRLAFADWLDEQDVPTVTCPVCKGEKAYPGQDGSMRPCKVCSGRGEYPDENNPFLARFIRLQVKLAALGEMPDDSQCVLSQSPRHWCPACSWRDKAFPLEREINLLFMSIVHRFTTPCPRAGAQHGVNAWSLEAVRRGFLHRLRMGGNEWAAVADKVYWHPKQMKRCSACFMPRFLRERVSAWLDPARSFNCIPCNNTGEVPREFVEDAWPLREVTLTSLPAGFSTSDRAPWDSAAAFIRDAKDRWPGIEFKIELMPNPDTWDREDEAEDDDEDAREEEDEWRMEVS